jgi:hypothetical protein
MYVPDTASILLICAGGMLSATPWKAVKTGQFSDCNGSHQWIAGDFSGEMRTAFSVRLLKVLESVR